MDPSCFCQSFEFWRIERSNISQAIWFCGEENAFEKMF